MMAGAATVRTPRPLQGERGRGEGAAPPSVTAVSGSPTLTPNPLSLREGEGARQGTFMPDRHLLREVFPNPARSSVSLGFELIELDAKAMTTRVRFNGSPEFTNPAGYIQGGYLVAMMDDAIGMLTTIKAGTSKYPSTVDLHTHFLRPVRVGPIEVAARLRNVGRAMVFAEADLFDSRGKEAARATASLTLNPVKAPVETPRS